MADIQFFFQMTVHRDAPTNRSAALFELTVYMLLHVGRR